MAVPKRSSLTYEEIGFTVFLSLLALACFIFWGKAPEAIVRFHGAIGCLGRHREMPRGRR